MADDESVQKSFVIVIGPLPPPMHGQAATTQAMVDAIGPRIRLQVQNTSQGTQQGLHARFSKAWRIFRGIFRLAINAPAHSRRTLYMVVDGGLGLFYNIIIACAARVFRYHIFVHHHSFAYIDKHSVFMATLARVMARSDVHIVLCAAMEHGLRNRYRALARVPMMELSSAAFLEASPDMPRHSRDHLKIGFLSNLIIEKGLDTTIDLFRAARGEGLPVRLVVAGKAPDERAVDIVRSAQLEFGEAMEYFGPLSEAQKAVFFRDIDAFVFPTRYVNEAQPRAVLESIFSGVPVLTNARGCISSDLGDRCGLCVPRGGDFVAHTLPLLRMWCADQSALAHSVREARKRAEQLREIGWRQLNGFVTILERGSGG